MNKCHNYKPWFTVAKDLRINECYWYVNGKCDCPVDTSHHNKPCPWEGYPEGPLPESAATPPQD
jgi:hypothetical protein